jgi:hypothetical protein
MQTNNHKMNIYDKAKKMEVAMKKSILTLSILIFMNFAFAIKICNLPEVMKPVFFQINGDDLFIVESSTNSILVYSSDSCKLRHSLGKSGEGPGEFKHLPLIREVSHDTVVCSSVEKIIWYTREGKIIKEQILPQSTMFPIPIKDNFIIMRFDTNFKTLKTDKILLLANSKFEPIKEFYRVLFDANRMFQGGTGDEECRLLHHYFGYILYNNKIFIADSLKGFVIDVFDSSANNLYSINLSKKIERIRVDGQYREKALEGLKLFWLDLYKSRKKSAFTIYEYFPPIRQFWIDNNKIYITTFKKQGDDHELIILDIKGNILGKLFLPLKSMRDYNYPTVDDLFTVYKGILYELIENDQTEIWELHKTKISSIKEYNRNFRNTF